jgi:RNA:NAD 2'-phosphotransferase (TPT1/KptA family)
MALLQTATAHVTLDSAGWLEVGALLAGCAKAGRALSREDLEHVVVTNAKKRFEFSADGARIRACQGHSIEVELEYAPQEPPELLYHGTATRFLDSIRFRRSKNAAVNSLRCSIPPRNDFNNHTSMPQAWRSRCMSENWN